MSKLLHRLKRFIEIKPNPQKLLNYLLNKISKFLICDYALGMPHQFLLEITNLCNLHCQLCPTGNGSLKRNKIMMTFDNFKKIIDKMSGYLIEINFAGFGEPFLNEDIYRMLEYIKNKGIFIRIYTNLLCLDKFGLERIVDYKVDKLVVSLDVPNANLYFRYKGADGFNKVMDNLRCLLEIKRQRRQKNPLVDLQFIMMKDNVTQIDSVKQIAKDIGVNTLSLKTPNLYLCNSDNYSNLELEEHFLSKDFNRYDFNNSRILPCPWVWERLIIYANGDIGPCCYDAQGDYIFGNIFLEDIGNIWNNKKYRIFRKGRVDNTNNNQLCSMCMERRRGIKLAVGYPLNKFKS